MATEAMLSDAEASARPEPCSRALGLSQHAFARLARAHGIDLSQSTVSRIEAGKLAATAAYLAACRKLRGRRRIAYYRPCLSPDPAERIGQLETLLAQARKELEP